MNSCLKHFIFYSNILGMVTINAKNKQAAIKIINKKINNIKTVWQDWGINK